MIDYVVSKPASVRGYALHRIAEGLTGGGRPLFTDFGDHMLLRSNQTLDAPERPLRQVKAGDIVGFELRACVSAKVKGKHRYFHTGDWRRRHLWLERQGLRHGFAVVTVHCTATIATVSNGTKTFTVDQTDFTGVLKVIDESAFALAMVGGIGSTGRAFGLGMLNL